ncbi:unnamed protein product [Caenorhabditis angaria]|uniref:Uncharacterized protein n=1 Tax=Caenorhabditis angaria TaxID=860376 RepID=A0A9P1J234_9PELO|nr:unnamed protein product [Caenorhabditis angaria]
MSETWVYITSPRETKYRLLVSVFEAVIRQMSSRNFEADERIDIWGTLRDVGGRINAMDNPIIPQEQFETKYRQEIKNLMDLYKKYQLQREMDELDKMFATVSL